MNLSTATSAVVRAFRRRPSDLLPFYLLGAAAPVVARTGAFLVLGVVYLFLEASGRLDAVRSELATVDTTPPEFDPESEEYLEWLAEVLSAFDPLFAYPLDIVLGVTLVATVVAMVLAIGVLTAVLSAGQLAACDARLRDERGLTAGIAGVRRYWLSFLGLLALEIGLWLAGIAVIGAGLGVVALALAAVTGTGLVAVPLALVGLLVLVAFGVVVRALFAFAPVVVVVDDVGALGSVPRTVGFVRRRPVPAAFYYVVSAGSLVAYGIVSGTAAFFGGSIVLAVASMLVLTPVLDLLKTALYGLDRGTVSPPAPVDRSIRTQLVDGTRRGWRELLAFVRDAPGLHAVAIASGAVGFWMGWVAADPFVGIVETSISSRLEGHVPPRAALGFFGNNWLVALTTAYSGVVLAVPALASLWFNGLFIGATARLEVDLAELVAFVVPHGLLEIPAIFVAGAVGVFLGVTWWRAIRGRLERAALADALERAFWVLIGVGILLAVAAFIEGFVSPYYFRPFL